MATLTSMGLPDVNTEPLEIQNLYGCMFPLFSSFLVMSTNEAS